MTKKGRASDLPKYIIVNRVTVGDVDPMSRAVRRANLPRCGALEYGTEEEPEALACTRAAGHDEAQDGTPAALHVCVGDGDVVLSVWPPEDRIL